MRMGAHLMCCGRPCPTFGDVGGAHMGRTSHIIAQPDGQYTQSPCVTRRIAQPGGRTGGLSRAPDGFCGGYLQLDTKTRAALGRLDGGHFVGLFRGRSTPFPLPSCPTRIARPTYARCRRARRTRYIRHKGGNGRVAGRSSRLAVRKGICVRNGGFEGVALLLRPPRAPPSPALPRW